MFGTVTLNIDADQARALHHWVHGWLNSNESFGELHQHPNLLKLFNEIEGAHFALNADHGLPTFTHHVLPEQSGRVA